MTNFLIFESIQVISIYAITYALGIAVTKRNVKVNYTRKMFSLSLLILALFVLTIFPVQFTAYTTLLNGLIVILCLSSMAKPFRNRSKFLTTTFAAINRPEDVPYTLVWLPTELLIMSTILFSMKMYLAAYQQSTLFYIIILITGLGDTVAEPVGTRFGKHKYRVISFVSDRKYTRSLEGSLSVFITGLVVVIGFQHELTSEQFILALLILPITMTLTEGLSPHTWDGPFLYLIGSLATIFILETSPS